MKNQTWGILLLCLLFLMAPACKASKKQAKRKKSKANSSIAKIEKELAHNYFDPEWFSAKMKIKYKEIDGSSLNFNADLRMQKDKVIWLSISPNFGIKFEVARAKITPDGVQALDKMQKYYYNKDFDYLEQFVDYPLDFNSLQSILLGQALQIAEYQNIQDLGDKIKLSSPENTIFINEENFTLVQMILQDVLNNRSIIANLEDYNRLDGQYFSYQRDYKLETDKKYEVDIKFSKTKTDGPLEFPFKVSSKYTEID